MYNKDTSSWDDQLLELGASQSSNGNYVIITDVISYKTENIQVQPFKVYIYNSKFMIFD